ncbi:MAG: hypothetical protein QOE54_4960 [Streptosporangiaceae bacterium]|jgi:hypothetical protein|nr:hypothetical protein [Streptosporangiaceae bacterium]MDX6432594.1 hypothetical protein [Streptosporangiaceae bacterium]
MAEHDDTARTLTRGFPGWRCWYGPYSHSWWALPPPLHRQRSLLEAPTAEDLAALIRQAQAALTSPGA